ncbi:hypothetical protein LOTGIDRAFT_229425 [Lottia gigantea]|uniref:Uncharacterized protein n=1 Tax=Lottia gigantea TaxID=225164 RepID=V3Z434_LOTGI|nr:hypothetical protein LOTGIDRAFT_229425 [Lottia gigantea]ESO85403.1 hypothetical protein LOTGIDRAFT_229425 [Lottia gigantea]
MSGNVSKKELEFQLKQLHGSKKLEMEQEAQDRHSLRVQRYMDKEIKATQEELGDIVASTSQGHHPRRRGSIPTISVSPAALNAPQYSHYQEGDHLKIKTKHNLILSEKLSDNIRTREARRRERSLSPARDIRRVSSASIENLFMAANVLRDTEHGEEALKLLETLTAEDDQATARRR